MSDRKAELERKKAKLEQLRAEKKRADEEKRKGLHASGSSSSLGAGASPIASRSTEADDILKELGIVTSESPGQQPNVEPSAAKSSSEMMVGGSVSVGGVAAEVPVADYKKSAMKSLGVSKVTQTNIPPRELVQYCKETQTIEVIAEDEDSHADTTAADDEPASQSASNIEQKEEPEAEETAPPPRILSEDECKQVCL